jgi:hypothetical protein
MNIKLKKNLIIGFSVDAAFADGNKQTLSYFYNAEFQEKNN